MRAIWKGAITFGLVNVPVKVYSATEDHDVPLHQVHDEDGGRIRYRRVCESQDEVDRYWSVLTADGGQESQCGWLKDRFGLSWQIVPVEFLRMLQDPDPARVQRVVDVMMTQAKLDLGPLRAAYEG